MHCSPPTTTAPLTPNTPNGDYDDDSCEYGVPTPHILSILSIFVKGVCGYFFPNGMMTGPNYYVFFN